MMLSCARQIGSKWSRIAAATVNLTQIASPSSTTIFGSAFSSAAANTASSSSVANANTGSSSSVANVATNLDRIRIDYRFTNDQNSNVVRAKIPLLDGEHIDANALVDILVRDGVNLRTIREIRYWSVVDEGFVALPVDGHLRVRDCISSDQKLRLQFIKNSFRSVIGPSFSVDPNIGAFIDILNPIVALRFTAANQNVQRFYRAYLSTIGPRIDISLRVQSVFWFKAPFKETFKHERIELGRGIDITWGLLFTYVNFKNYSGGILMVGVPLGLSAGISFIKGGYLVPLEHPENEPVPHWQRERDSAKVPGRVETSTSDDTPAVES